LFVCLFVCFFACFALFCFVLLCLPLLEVYVSSLSVVEAIGLKATTPLFADVGRMSVEQEVSRRFQ